MPRRGVRQGKRVQGETAAKRWCLPASKESAPRRGASAANGGASLSACIESGNLSLLRDRDNYIMKIERDDIGPLQGLRRAYLMLLQYGVCYGCRGGKLYCAGAVPAYCVDAMKSYCVFAGWAYSVILRFDIKDVKTSHAF